jgi:hypothetical protein
MEPDNKNIPYNQEFLHMQKLAGLITEEEYKSQSQELDLMNLSNKITKKWGVIKQHLKDQGYDI